MAKVTELSADLMTTETGAGQRAAVTKKATKEKKEDLVPLQIRIPAKDAKAIKIDAIKAGLSASDFLLSCYHANKKS